MDNLIQDSDIQFENSTLVGGTTTAGLDSSSSSLILLGISSLEFNQSKFINSSIFINNYNNQNIYKDLKINKGGTLSFINNSLLKNCQIDLSSYDLLFSDSIWIDTPIYAQGGNITIEYSEITLTQTTQDQYDSAAIIILDSSSILQDDYDDYDDDDDGNSIIPNVIIYKTNFKCSNNIYPYQILFIENNYYVSMESITIEGFRIPKPLFRNFGENSTLDMNDILVKDCIAASFIQVSNSTTGLKNMKFKNNEIDAIFTTLDYSYIHLADSNITCEDGNTFIKTITMPISSPVGGDGGDGNGDSMNSYQQYGSTTLVLISNVIMSCSGSFDFQNSSVVFEYSTFESYFLDTYVTLYSESVLTVFQSNILANSINGVNTMFLLDGDGGLYLTDCNFNFTSSAIASSFNGSYVTIENSTFTRIQSNEQPMLFIENSYLNIMNVTFMQDQSSSSSLIYITESNLLISNVSVIGFGQVLIQADNTSIGIHEFFMTNCYTQTQLFQFSNGDVMISDSIFSANQGYGFQLFNLYGVNFTVTNTVFQSNSFSPLIKSFDSFILFDGIELDNHVGSFYYSDNDFELFINNFTFNNNKATIDYFLNVNYCRNLIFSEISMVSNYFTQYLTFIKYSMVTFDNWKFENNIIVNVSQESPFNDIFQTSISVSNLNSLFILFECPIIHLNQFNIIDNSIDSSMFIILNSLEFIYQNGEILRNQISNSGFTKYFFQIQDSSSKFINSNISLNYGLAISLINSTGSNLTLNNCEMSNNNFIRNGNGSIISYSPITILNNFTIPSNQNYNYFKILNSIFNYNIGKFGGVFYFKGFSKKISKHDLFFQTNNKFLNNTFEFNRATQQAGCIYTKDFTFDSNMNNTLTLNKFRNNTSMYGSIFSSQVKKVVIDKEIQVLNGIDAIIEFYFIDYYNSTFLPLSTTIDINVTRIGDSDGNNYNSTIIPIRIITGRGKLIYNFIGYINQEYIIESKEYSMKSKVYVKGCLPFQYYNVNGSCVYCEIGYSWSPSLNQCYKCNDDSTTCIDSIVNTRGNYYMIDQDVALTESCPLDMCTDDNVCISNESIGHLCFQCIYIGPNQTTLSVAKNGIQCCKYFKPHYLIPTLILIYLIFALLLSVLKYNVFNNDLANVILFLQTNAVVLFPYKGIYLLPVFRISIDILDGYCLFPTINYNLKSLISLSIIISLFLIGSTDITLKFLIFYYNNSNGIGSWWCGWCGNKKDDDNNKKNYPIYLNKIIQWKNKYDQDNSVYSDERNTIYFQKSIWSLFLLFLIPILSNLLPLLIYKELTGSLLLSIDFSIEYYQTTLNRICIFISSFLIVGILIVSIIFLIISSRYSIKYGGIGSKNKQQHFIRNIDHNGYSDCMSSNHGLLFRINQFIFNFQEILVSNLNYKTNFKWWDFLIILKSFGICLISATMIFNSDQYMIGLISIQLVYCIVYFFFNPIKKNSSKDRTNTINVFQLIILLIANSQLIQNVSNYYQGLILTIITFLLTILYLIYYRLLNYFKYKNNNNHRYTRLISKEQLNKNKTIN